MHEWLDICARPGTPVKATAEGVVIYSGWKSDFGKLVTIDHGYGYRTRYGHLSKIYVKNGRRVKRGETVGAVGNTGRSTGPNAIGLSFPIIRITRRRSTTSRP